VADQPRHEVFLELSSGSRVLVGTDLPDVAAANAIARHWRQLAETEPDILHETMPGSGCIVRGSAIVAIKARPMAAPSRAQTLLGTAAPDGTWL
jgi:hypothetical protein